MKRFGSFFVYVAIILLSGLHAAHAQQQISSRVDISWNRFYDYDEITAHLHALVEAYPNLLTLESIGTSVQGRQMWLVTLNNSNTGDDTDKPAMYIDGNVHGNEIQAAETVLYSIWYLTKSYGHVEQLTELVDRVAFYFVPMVNPDGRANWFATPTNPHDYRSGMRPTDNDYDGLLDEDGPDDLDGDGHIGTMWRFDHNGRYRRNRDNPQIIERIEAGQVGELERAGWEGIDNDGDGRTNEDGPGGYDMNRNWPSDWQPNHVQFGAGDYPFSYPETKSIGTFILNHPNIAAGQSYHNAGGMLLRGPGASYRDREYPRRDLGVYNRLGEVGEEMLPFYDYMIIHADLYRVHGGFVNWLAEGLGIISFTNELWTDDRIAQSNDAPLDREARRRWSERILFGQTTTRWTEVTHPEYGRVLVGGGTKYSSRIPPSFMLEEECHRNFAFTMYHASNMPELSFTWIEVRQLGDDLWQVSIEISNEQMIPTRTQRASDKNIGLPDRLKITGDDIAVVASGFVSNRHDRTMRLVEHHPDDVRNDNGVPGEGRSTYRAMIKGQQGAELTLEYVAEKAMNISTTVRLVETARDQDS